MEEVPGVTSTDSPPVLDDVQAASSPAPDRTAWLAGLLEGEGCFYADFRDGVYPGINLTMTDKDVVDRVASAWQQNVHPRTKGNSPNAKTPYVTRVGGSKALGVMLEVYPHMGERRKDKIQTILHKWEHHTQRKAYSK